MIFNDALVGIAERFLKKGSKVYLEGQLETRKWTDKDGSDKYSTEVVLRPYRGELLMLDRAGSGEGMGNDNYNQDRSYAATGTGGSAAIPADFDDEIPF